jgi:hypothetical protein
MPEADAGKHWYNPFDLTKVWPHGDYPLIEVGVLELNRNPENYFAESRAGGARPRTSCRASAIRPTRCCRRASSPMPTRTAIASAQSPPVAGEQAALPGEHYHADGADALRGHANGCGTPTPITSRTRSAARSRKQEQYREPPLKISGDADRYNHATAMTTIAARRSVPADDRYRAPGLQPHLEARPDRAQPARYRFLQAADAADDLGHVSQGRCHLLADQPHDLGEARRRHRRAGTARPARPCAHAALLQEGDDLAGG